MAELIRRAPADVDLVAQLRENANAYAWYCTLGDPNGPTRDEIAAMPLTELRRIAVQRNAGPTKQPARWLLETLDELVYARERARSGFAGA
jgi:hypothetical protein